MSAHRGLVLGPIALMMTGWFSTAHAQQRLHGDWALRGGSAARAIMRLGTVESTITVRDSSGVHAYPVRIARVGESPLLIVTRDRGTDSLTVRLYGRRTLFAEQRRGGRTVSKQVYVRVTEKELARYELELRKGASSRR